MENEAVPEPLNATFWVPNAGIRPFAPPEPELWQPTVRNSMTKRDAAKRICLVMQRNVSNSIPPSHEPMCSFPYIGAFMQETTW